MKSSVLLAGLHASGPTRRHRARRRHGIIRSGRLTAFGVTRRPRRACRRGRRAASGCSGATSRSRATSRARRSGPRWPAGTAGQRHRHRGRGPQSRRGSALLDILRRAGASVDVTIERRARRRTVGRVTHLCAGQPRASASTPGGVPGVIDEIPALAALGAMMPEGSTMEVRGAAELRVKESDRISALAAGFRAMGAASRIPTTASASKRGRSTGGSPSMRPAIIGSPWPSPSPPRGAAAPTTIAGAGVGRRVVSRVLRGARAAHDAGDGR